ncbi:hypothetical protein TNIN_478431 [Trichonephila inaurata madagascariensis]|uniref:Uncharacterized protein n=1 Tax=Trichonephila inaurata madagascariensis TaxID=2747483 RepID=A0A8X6YNU8_9ARAC|nr:hypothetical protein TNIN_478431 [Trichonephila inaurata madagascariensis]
MNTTVVNTYVGSASIELSICVDVDGCVHLELPTTVKQLKGPRDFSVNRMSEISTEGMPNNVLLCKHIPYVYQQMGLQHEVDFKRSDSKLSGQIREGSWGEG